MISGKRVLALIPARAGSKRLPGKNTRPLAGKPLIAWTVEAAAGSRYIDRIAVTTDDHHAAFCAMNAGAHTHVNRPKSLAADGSPVIEAVFHALDQLGDWDFIVLLQPTSPLRTSEDIDAAIEMCVKTGRTVVGVTDPAKPSGFYRSRDTMEEVEPFYVLSGAVYVAPVPVLSETREFCAAAVSYYMPRERAIDIDKRHEFEACEAILREKRPASGGIFGPYGGPAPEDRVVAGGNG